MKQIICVACCFIMIFMITGCNNFKTVEEKGVVTESQEGLNVHNESSTTEVTTEINKDIISIYVTIENKTFIAELKNNETTKALIEMFPFTINMQDLHRNEKYYNFPDSISNEKGENPKTINSGDIMVWSGNYLVLFYKTFPTSYSGYVPIGSIQDVTGLEAALGNGSVDVTFSLIK